MFFYNIYLGFFSCIIRMITNASLCLLFIGRLDFSIMARSFESRDAGFKAYLGFLHVHHAHSNPHLLTFIHLLLEEIKSEEEKCQINLRGAPLLQSAEFFFCFTFLSFQLSYDGVWPTHCNTTGVSWCIANTTFPSSGVNWRGWTLGQLAQPPRRTVMWR